MSLVESEYLVLRQSIALRGTVRMALLPITAVAWAASALVLLLVNDLPLAVIFSLAILAAGFEAIHALHVGVERIGRYVQVYYETSGDGPQWETTAMGVGTALPGGGVDPLFTLLFGLFAAVNLVPALVLEPTPTELVALAVPHAAFLARIVRSRLAAAKQRPVELESYRAMKTGSRSA